MRTLALLPLATAVVTALACGSGPPDEHAAPELFGCYSTGDVKEAGFAALALFDAHEFILDNGNVCAQAPCPSKETGAWWSTDFAGKSSGTLWLRDSGETAKTAYDVVREPDGTLVLSRGWLKGKARLVRQLEDDPAATTNAPELVGSYPLSSERSGDFTSVDLLANGSYIARLDIVCAKAPCPTTKGGKWRSSPIAEQSEGVLVLDPGPTARRFSVAIRDGGKTLHLSGCHASAVRTVSALPATSAPATP